MVECLPHVLGVASSNIKRVDAFCPDENLENVTVGRWGPINDSY